MSNMVLGWSVPAPAPFHGPSTGIQALVARQRCELPSMSSHISCNAFMTLTNVGFRSLRAHISITLPFQIQTWGIVTAMEDFMTSMIRYQSWLADHTTVEVQYRCDIHLHLLWFSRTSSEVMNVTLAPRLPSAPHANESDSAASGNDRSSRDHCEGSGQELKLWKQAGLRLL